MTLDWQSRETTTHQDHVIAHVIGASALGYLVLNEALYILLDIGFVWMIFLDGEMGLLPHPVAVSELEIAEADRQQIKADIDVLLSDNGFDETLLQVIQPLVDCLIKDVNFFDQGDRRRLIITGEDATLGIETSLTTAEIQVYGL